MDDLAPNNLIFAYVNGYFPMADEKSKQIRWFQPDPRAIVELADFHVSRSLRRKLRRADYSASIDSDFLAVIKACALREETWISAEIISAYAKLHVLGLAHSVEIYADRQLVGGVYGVAIAGAFFAESMFHLRSDCSKLALFHLVEHLKSRGFSLFECQFLTPHLQSLGAKAISSREYMQRLGEALCSEVSFSDTPLPQKP